VAAVCIQIDGGSTAARDARPDMNNYFDPDWRPLAVYAFDPSVGRRLSNHMTIKVPFERLQPGPVGSRLAVIDYDASNQRLYEAVDLDHPAVTLCGGLPPSESDPRFHQQMVYAVASETIRRFDLALGRPVKWRRPTGGRSDDPGRRRLRIFPHAFQQANAYYDPNLRAVLFGYFRAESADVGDLPNQVIFTCLSHDIIAHEITHAILDGMREHFSEPTSVDTPAFHEAFADIVALFQHFSMRDALIDTIRRTGGEIHRSDLAPVVSPGGPPRILAELTEHNPLVELGKQFGEAMGMRSALRQALGTPPNSRDLAVTAEPHSRGAILVAAVFDAFFTSYIKRTRDLMRIARAHGALVQGGDIHPDLAERLCQEATKCAGQFLGMCIRAIDYCPPVDILFGEYLRAVVTADSDLVTEDKWDYRGELIKAFRLRGIIPEDVQSYSEEALRWWAPEQTAGRQLRCDGLVFETLPLRRDGGDDADRAETIRLENARRARENARTLWRFAMAHPAELALADAGSAAAPVAVHSFHQVNRIAPDGRLVKDFVVEFLQQRSEHLDPNDAHSPTFLFRGGSTVVLDETGKVRYVICKRISNAARLQRQRQYEAERGRRSAAAAFTGRVEAPSFAAVHRGY
jgi:hypothetical protein